MYEPDEERDDGRGADERPTVDWDAWEKNRLRNPWTRLWLLMMLVGAVSMLALYFQSGGTAIRWGPPGK